MDLAELFDKGGALMWPILAASAVAATVFVERLFALRRSRILPGPLYEALHRHLEAEDVARAAGLCRESDSMLARIAAAGLDHRVGGRDAVKEAMEETGGVEVGRLDSGVGIVSTVAAIAPLLGLLGTVAGMITVFKEVAGADNPDIRFLAAGIWEALITTGAGLTVAIPAFVAARFVEGRIDRFGRELEEASLSLLDRMVPPASAAAGGGGDVAAPEASAAEPDPS